MAGLSCSLVTVARGDYRLVLVIALTCALLAAACLALAFRNGGVIVRFYCVVLLLPSLFVFWDFARRAPAVFRSR